MVGGLNVALTQGLSLVGVACLQESVMNEVGSLRWGNFKPRLADALVEHLAPIRSNYTEIMKV